MPVQKFNSSTKINNQAIPYLQINSNVVQNLTDMESGWIWVYLLSKPTTWNVIKSHVKNHFKIGENKLKKIFSYLNKCNLIEYVPIRDEKGLFTHSDINVLNGENFINIDKLSTSKSSRGLKIDPMDTEKSKSVINQRHQSRGLKTHRLDNQTSGFQGSIYNRNTDKIEKDKKDRESLGAKIAPLSAFVPSEENQILAKELRIDIDKELVSFKERHNGRKTQYEFGRWLKMAFEHSQRKVSKIKIEDEAPRSAVNRMTEYVSQKNIIRKQI